MDGRLAD